MDAAILNDEIALLGALAFFADFERDALRLIAFSADTRIVRAGDTLFRKGDGADAAFLMLSGSVALTTSDDGSPAEAIFGRGSLLGQTALIAETFRPATAIMREPGAILKITRTLMLRVLDTYPTTAENLKQRLTTELSTTLSGVQEAMERMLR